MEVSNDKSFESLLMALEEIADDHKTLMGHGDYMEGPMSGEDAQNIARRALDEIHRLKGERDAMSYVAHAVVDQMERLGREEGGRVVVADPTPGHWGIEKSSDLWWVGVIGPDGKAKDIVATFSVGINYHPSHCERNKANAILIAAAPDLLSAAQKVVNNWGDLHHKDLMQLRAAIAKATGGQ